MDKKLAKIKYPALLLLCAAFCGGVFALDVGGAAEAAQPDEPYIMAPAAVAAVAETADASTENCLVDENGAPYRIEGLVHGEPFDVEAPKLKYGGEITSTNARLYFKYEDYANEVMDIGNAAVSLSDDELDAEAGNIDLEATEMGWWEHFINPSMPAGSYHIYCEVDEVTDKGVAYPGFSCTIEFTVSPSDMLNAWGTELNGMIGGKEYRFLASEQKTTLYAVPGDEQNVELFVEEKSELIQLRRGYWASKTYTSYYSNGIALEYQSENEPRDKFDSSAYKAQYILGNRVGAFRFYFRLSAQNYVASSVTRDSSFTVYNVGVIRGFTPGGDLPESYNQTYDGEYKQALISGSEIYTVTQSPMIDTGTYPVTLTINEAFKNIYIWEGQTLDTATDSITVYYKVEKAQNYWESEPTFERWVEGEYDSAENVFIGKAKFGNDTVKYKVVDINDTSKVYYDSETGLNELADLDAGNYFLIATVAGTDNYTGLGEQEGAGVLIRVLEREGMPGWAVLLIVLGVLAAVALVIFILWKKGVFRIITDKIVLAMRTRAVVDSTIASIRAQKMREEVAKNRAEGIAKEKADERKKQRKEALAAQRALPAEEKAAQMDAKAKQAAERAEKMRLKAEAMSAKAQRMREQARQEQEEKTHDEPETPDKETPVTETPVTETPVTETPATETPVTETPVTEAPTSEAPAEEAPTDEGESK